LILIKKRNRYPLNCVSTSLSKLNVKNPFFNDNILIYSNNLTLNSFQENVYIINYLIIIEYLNINTLINYILHSEYIIFKTLIMRSNTSR
jgi:hypothetical protein